MNICLKNITFSEKKGKTAKKQEHGEICHRDHGVAATREKSWQSCSVGRVDCGTGCVREQVKTLESELCWKILMASPMTMGATMAFGAQPIERAR